MGDRLKFERKTTMHSSPRRRFWVSAIIISLLLLPTACTSSSTTSPSPTPTQQHPTTTPTTAPTIAPTSPPVPHLTYRGNSSRVITLDWSPDGKRIVSG